MADRSSGRRVATRKPPRRANPRSLVDGAVTGFVELIASEAEAWAVSQRRQSDDDILTRFVGNAELSRASILDAFARALRTGETGQDGLRWEGATLPPRPELVGAYLVTHGAKIPLAAAMARVASEAEAWAEELGHSRNPRGEVPHDEIEAMKSFAVFLRTGDRPEWHVSLTQDT